MISRRRNNFYVVEEFLGEVFLGEEILAEEFLGEEFLGEEFLGEEKRRIMAPESDFKNRIATR